MIRSNQTQTQMIVLPSEPSITDEQSQGFSVFTRPSSEVRRTNMPTDGGHVLGSSSRSNTSTPK